jgi:drug/metabolite transporter (DMT)-like permease
MSSVVFSTVLGVFLLGEKLYLRNAAGLLLVLSGIFLVNVHRGEDANKGDLKYIWLALASCLLNAISGTMDKIYTDYVTAGQLQFWYMFFMVVLYIIYIISTKTKVSLNALKSNQWIWLLSILFVLADRALFVANSNPDSSVTVMTLIKQSCVIVSILFGKIVFKEKNILYKFFCSLLIIVGILCVTI